MNNGMIVNLQIGMWSGHKLDKTQTLELLDNAQAERDAARVNKHLVSRDSLKAVTQAAGALRQFFYRAALPWGDNGDRILGTAAYLAFMDQYSDLKDEFLRAVDEFVKGKYPAERARAQFRMGTMFIAEDYPPPEDLRSRFYVHLSLHGVPTGEDFRVQLQAADVERIKHEIDEGNAARLKAAMQTVWDRLFTTVSHFAERMGEDAKFRESTVVNLQALAEEIPALNITNDPALNALSAEIHSRLSGLSAPDLRKHPDLKEKARKDAVALANKVAQMMAGSGG